MPDSGYKDHIIFTFKTGSLNTLDIQLSDVMNDAPRLLTNHIRGLEDDVEHF